MGKGGGNLSSNGGLWTTSFPSVILLFTHSITLLGQDITVLFCLMRKEF